MVTLPKRDSGLQPERTGLAWSRTGFLTMLVALLSARISIASHELAHLCGALLLALAAGLMLHQGHVCGGTRNDSSSQVDTKRRILGLTSLIIVVAGALHGLAVLLRLQGAP